MQLHDYSKGYMDVLAQLTHVWTVTEESFKKRFLEMKADGNYYIVVMENTSTGKIVASGTLLLEKKFLRSCGVVGHVEDIVVDKGERGKDFGKYIIDQLKHLGTTKGCYKLILDCSEDKIPFYMKCGFEKREQQMAIYLKKSNL
uniref:Glucosamine 6-phosphate N-acetyltransferase n=1 Tax=Arcella intermedia TaxID=1963864 RepID=A0A6B2LPJ2_9EUKA